MSEHNPDFNDDGTVSPGAGAPAGPDDESGIARVLRAAGGRAHPADDMKAAVRAAVHAEWRATVAKRRQRRTLLAIAASIAVAALALWVSRPYFTPGAVIASVSRTTGSVQSRAHSWNGWQTLAVAEAQADGAANTGASAEVRAGTTLMTGADGRVALQLRDGVSLRLDHDTRIAFIDAGHVDVKSGAVYVDAGTAPSASDHLRVGTPAGVVQHVGTQYEARLVSGGTRISVREGRVNLLPTRGNAQSAGVGEQLLVSAAGVIQRSAIAPSDAQWEWAASAAPTFAIDGRPVRDFLAWIGRELGREIVFADAESEAEADRAVLSGSVAGLTPAEALPAVLATTKLRSVAHDDKIEIARQANP